MKPKIVRVKGEYDFDKECREARKRRVSDSSQFSGSVLDGLFDNMATGRREFYDNGKQDSFIDCRIIAEQPRRLTPAWAKPFGHYPEPND